MRYINALFVTFLLMTTAAGAIVQPPQFFFKGWKPAGSVRHYDAGTLYIYMDGAAELFLETGFTDLSVQSYKNTASKELLLELFRMSGDTAALSMFLWEAGEASDQNGIGVPCKINPYQLVFYANEYYVRIANFSGDRQLLPAMKKLAKALLKKIGTYRKLHLLERLPVQGRIAFSERIFRGAVGLRRFLGRSLKLPLLDRSVYALGAKYQDKVHQHYYSIVLLYPDALAARKGFQTLTNMYAKQESRRKTIELVINSKENIHCSLKGNLLYLILYFNQ